MYMYKHFLILAFFFGVLLQGQIEEFEITDQQEREILQQLIVLDKQSFQVIHHYLVLSVRANIDIKPQKNIVLYIKLLPIAQKNLSLLESIFRNAEYLREKKSDNESTNGKTPLRSFETIVTELNMAQEAIKIIQLRSSFCTAKLFVFPYKAKSQLLRRKIKIRKALNYYSLIISLFHLKHKFSVGSTEKHFRNC